VKAENVNMFLSVFINTNPIVLCIVKELFICLDM